MREQLRILCYTLQSPWLYELKNKRAPYLFDNRVLANDVVIVGGGIAGVSTAYYILHNTNRNVTLLEGNTIASGATGHNAGQIVTYFERPQHGIYWKR